MDESQYQSPIEEEKTAHRLLGNWRSCLLLSVILLGLLATPLAVFYRWYADRLEVRMPAVSGNDGAINRIAFITSDHQLATMAPNGSQLRRLTDLNRILEFPTWAPDGSQVAVIAGETIYLVPDAEGSTNRRPMTELYESVVEPPFYLYWSPDSQYVSFLASHPDGIALHLAEATAPEAQMLAVGQPFYWDWAPGADRLLIHSGDSGDGARLEMIDLLGERAGGDFGDPGFFQAPGISGSGRYQAFAELDENGRSRLVVLENDADRHVYEAHLGQLAMTWSPASDLLAYTSPRLNARIGGGPLRLLDPAGNENSVLSNENVLAFFWSPDGRTIAYFTLPRDDGGNVRVAQRVVERNQLSRAQRQPSEIRLELWAVDVSSGHERRLAYFAPNNLFLRQFLPYFDQYSLSHRLWSPHSDALVIPVIQEGRSQIAVAPLNSGPIRLIGDGEIAFWSHQ